jgi:hypothetical protein
MATAHAACYRQVSRTLIRVTKTALGDPPKIVDALNSKDSGGGDRSWIGGAGSGCNLEDAMRNPLRWIALPVTCAGLAACQYSGTTNGQHSITVTAPMTIPPLPPGSPGARPPGVGSRPPGLPVDGEYAGLATTLTNPGQKCSNTYPIEHWIVSGDQVRFRAFKGTIAPDGGLKMQVGTTYIIGTFHGSHFEGRQWRPQPSCTYALSLDLVAP